MTKEARKYNREISVFTKWCWEKWMETCKKKKGNQTTLLYQINSKWIKDLDVKTWNYKTSKGTQVVLYDISLSNILHMFPCKRETEEKNKWEYIKLKHFCTEKETINKTAINKTANQLSGRRYIKCVYVCEDIC